MAKKTTKKVDKKKPMTKSQVISAIADETGLTKKDVTAVFDSLGGLIKKNLAARGPQEFNLMGWMKLKTVKKPATKARKGRNPFTGEEITIAAKPASKSVKVRALKSLKDMV